MYFTNLGIAKKLQNIYTEKSAYDNEILAKGMVFFLEWKVIFFEQLLKSEIEQS